jgi:hypothetical protein
LYWTLHGSDPVPTGPVRIWGEDGTTPIALVEELCKNLFTPDLTVVSGSLSARYWELHRALEEQGRLDHARDECPDRDGPRAIEVWTPETGWRAQTIR